jgi:hypothetical protein
MPFGAKRSNFHNIIKYTQNLGEFQRKRETLQVLPNSRGYKYGFCRILPAIANAAPVHNPALLTASDIHLTMPKAGRRVSGKHLTPLKINS